MKAHKKYLSICLAAFFPLLSNAEILFHDSFESANMSATNPQGFSWEPNNKTSVVLGDGQVNKIVWSNGPINGAEQTSPIDFTAHSGNHSLMFRYDPGVAWTEQRFNLGTPMKEVWFSYYLRVPSNYYHCSTCSRQNNKFFSIWMDGYSQKGDGSTFWLSMEGGGSGNTKLAFTWSNGGFKSSNGMQQNTPFINIPQDRNRWMQVVIHLKAETSDGADDGVVEVWRRWANEHSFTLYHQNTNVGLRVPPNGPQGFVRGYLLGWANGAYAETTDWLLDDFKISSTSLLEAGLVTPAPRPPSGFTAESR